MDLATIGLSLTKLSDASNYIDIYDLVYYQKIISVLEERNKSFVLLLSNGKLIIFNPEDPTGKLYVENVWEQFINSEVISALLLEDYPCVFYLSNNTILHLKSNEGNIHTAQAKNLIAATLTLQYPIHRFSYNTTNKYILGISDNQIQVLCFNKKADLIPFAPFQPACEKFVCENSVLFSKKHSNTIYYLDRLQDAVSDCINFSKEANIYYILKKAVIDNKDITESKIHIMSFDSELVSFDLNNNDVFGFLTAQKSLYVLRGNKVFSVKLPVDCSLTHLRWNSSGMILLVLTETSHLLVYDSALNQLKVTSLGTTFVKFNLSPDSLMKRISAIGVGENILVQTRENLSVVKLLDGHLAPIPSHLHKGNFSEALACLDTIHQDTDFVSGFYLCWKFVYNNPQPDLIRVLESLYTRNIHSRLQGPYGNQLLVRLCYKLIHTNSFESAFLLARKLRSIRVLNDLAYFADFKGFKGIALLSKYEREQMDGDYISPRSELENLIKITGRTMTSNDFLLLLNDYEEIMNISKVNEALGKGGYLEEKNFWEIDLEAYTNALMLEGEGKFKEALEIYTSNHLTHEITRVNFILAQNNSALSVKETAISFESS